MSRCPICGRRVRHSIWSFAPVTHPRVEKGRCGGGHRLQRMRGTVIGQWELVEKDPQ